MIKSAFLLIILFYLAPKYGLAQFRTTTIRTPQGNATITTHNPFPRYDRFYFPTNLKHKFKVVLKNDSSFTCKAIIEMSDSISFIKIKQDGKKIKIYPIDTKEFVRIDGGEEWNAVITDTSWLFKIGIGKINTYSVVAEESTQIITAIQKVMMAPLYRLPAKIWNQWLPTIQML
jgi:hypothetical protein